MIKLFLLSMILILPGLAQSESFIHRLDSVPDVYMDSMIYEVRKGRSCESIRETQEKLIETQGRELVATGKALQLSEGKSATCGSMVDNLKDQVVIERQLNANQKKQFKKKTKTLKLGLLIETAVIVILLL